MFNHCTVTALALGYRVDLFLDALTAVDNAESTLKRHGLGHSKTGDTVHIGRNNGELQSKIFGKPAGVRDARATAGLPLLGSKKEIVKRFANPLAIDSLV